MKCYQLTENREGKAIDFMDHASLLGLFEIWFKQGSISKEPEHLIAELENCEPINVIINPSADEPVITTIRLLTEDEYFKKYYTDNRNKISLTMDEETAFILHWASGQMLTHANKLLEDNEQMAIMLLGKPVILHHSAIEKVAKKMAEIIKKYDIATVIGYRFLGDTIKTQDGESETTNP